MGLCTFQYKGHTIRDSAQQRSESSSACSQFVSIVIDNLRSRFTEEGDTSVLGDILRSRFTEEGDTSVIGYNLRSRFTEEGDTSVYGDNLRSRFTEEGDTSVLGDNLRSRYTEEGDTSVLGDNLRSRYTEKGDTSVLGALIKFFDPSLYCQSESDNSILSEVSSLVSSYLSSCGLGDISVVSQELVGFISYASVQVSRSPKLFSSVKDLVQLAVRSSTTYPAVSVAAECLLVSHLSAQ